MKGPGKYDDLCTVVRATAGADGVVLIVLNGKNGNGMSVQLPATVVPDLPRWLREIADQIEDDFKMSL